MTFAEKKMYGVQLNSREACSIIAYNGFAGASQPTFPLNGNSHRTCWYYERNAQTNTWAWQFHDNTQPNGKHYLKQILGTAE
jgi:hypothetical protein